MKKRPILFSGPMVRAILEGRKTQTRRVKKFRPPFDQPDSWPFVSQFDGGGFVWTDFKPSSKDLDILKKNGNGCKSPYGEVGDRLWVRETFRLAHRKAGGSVVIYRADDSEVWGAPWKPSIFMPRWASRITLEIVKVRVERVQDITYKDCEREGLIHGGRGAWSVPGWDGDPFREGYLGYQWLWDSINGKKHPWKKNPWVWVIEFKRI